MIKVVAVGMLEFLIALCYVVNRIVKWAGILYTIGFVCFVMIISSTMSDGQTTDDRFGEDAAILFIPIIVCVAIYFLTFFSKKHFADPFPAYR